LQGRHPAIKFLRPYHTTQPPAGIENADGK